LGSSDEAAMVLGAIRQNVRLGSRERRFLPIALGRDHNRRSIPEPFLDANQLLVLAVLKNQGQGARPKDPRAGQPKFSGRRAVARKSA
jgi:hypothetical protein